MLHEFTNFGRNLKFKPREFLAPRDEHDLLAILDRHQRGTIRVMGSKHAWSSLIQTEDVLIDMQHFDAIEMNEENGDHLVTVGAGCQIKKLVQMLNEHGLTTPSIGLITEQTVAGAIATGTHGSGKHSLSHYPSLPRFREICRKYDPHGVFANEFTSAKLGLAMRTSVEDHD